MSKTKVSPIFAISISTIILLFQLHSCGLSSKRKWRGEIIEGNVINDSILDGQITKYSPYGNVISKQVYKDGVLQGKSEYYYPNGKLKAQMSYTKDKLNGYYYRFDTLGDIVNSSYYFAGRFCGPVEYQLNNIVRSFYFYSFAGTLLSYYMYDSTGNIEIEHNDDAFCMNITSIKTLKGNKFNLFLYTPHPPKILMQYKVVSLDQQGVTTELASIPDSCVFYQLFLDTPKNEMQYAITLRYFDSTYKVNRVFRKRILLEDLYSTLQPL